MPLSRKTEKTEIVFTPTRAALEKAADDIYNESTELALVNKRLNNLKEQLEAVDAGVRVRIVNEVNPYTNQLKYKNEAAQNAAVKHATSDMFQVTPDYLDAQKEIATLEYDKEIQNAKLVRLHEKRRDIRFEAEMGSELRTPF